ncbi:MULTISPECIES: VOC family protein [unclassified Virgibacillus]|uniref:VOC family protein n=1 Tax=unclassified Virgibacillus TaxID=2620237 RepID=UPI0024DE5FFC|nr:VOC family protein [Virgibacillus sp. LDC-1]
MEFHSYPAIYVDYIHLKVSNLKRSLSFYQGVLGFNMLESKQKEATLTLNGIDPLLTIEEIENPIPRNPGETGLFHIAYLLPKRRDLASTLYHLLKTGYSIQGASDHLVSEAIYLADPDGNGIEIYIDRAPDTWKWNGQSEVKMATLPLDVDDLLKETEESVWSGLPKETRIGHIHLQVHDLKEVTAFYSLGFGFDVVSNYGKQARFISTSGYHHHIGLNTWNSLGGKKPHPLSIGIKYFRVALSKEQREKVKHRLVDLGYSVNTQSEYYTVQDPSGNIILF